MVAQKGSRFALMVLLCLGMILAREAAAADDDASTALPKGEQVFAVVNDKTISVREFEMQYVSLQRQRYYHGRIPEGQVEVLRKEATDLVVDRALQLEDAKRRGLKPDAAKVEQAVTEYDARYSKSGAWQKAREQVLPIIREQLAQQSLLEQLDKLQRTVEPPSVEDVQAYYDGHRELFTEPEKLHLSAILLMVDPSSTKEVWEQTRQEARDLLSRLKKGEDFAELARKHSGDPSASNGGDLGYIHRGMLPDVLHDQFDTVSLGEITGPIDLLEGIALLRLDGREAPRLLEFGDVETRARELLVREREGQAKKDALARLRSTARIEFFAAAIGDDSNKPVAAEEHGNGGIQEQ